MIAVSVSVVRGINFGSVFWRNMLGYYLVFLFYNKPMAGYSFDVGLGDRHSSECGVVRAQVCVCRLSQLLLFLLFAQPNSPSIQ